MKRAAGQLRLQSVGLGSRLRQKPAELSGGENQRVAIARALAKSPSLIFADEPTSALDSGNGQCDLRLLHEAAKKRGAAIIVVTHDPRLEAHADRLIRMEDGRILDDQMISPPPSVSSPPQDRSCVRLALHWLALCAGSETLLHATVQECAGGERSRGVTAPPSPYAAIANGKVDIEGGVDRNRCPTRRA